MMKCAISGEVPEEPVASQKSGLIYEKRLIQQHISENGKCPVTGQQHTMDDLVTLKTDKKHAAARSMIELGRKIARLERERRLLIAQVDLVALCRDIGAEEGEEVDHDAKRQSKITDSIVTELVECNKVLSQQRRKRKIPPTLAPVDALERCGPFSAIPVHDKNKPGITSIDIDLSKDIVATGGIDSNAVLHDLPSGDILSVLSGHSKKVTSVKLVAQNDVLISGSADETVRIWQGSKDGNYSCSHVLKDHSSEVQAVTVQATNNYFVTASLDRTWCFYDLSSGICLTQAKEALDSEGYTSAAFHPDGLLFGTGTAEGTVRIWDVRSPETFATCYRPSGAGAVTALSFSENGYALATAARDGVRVWDLRQFKSFQTFEVNGQDMPTNSIDFDHSGSYLAIAASAIRIYQVGSVNSEWNCIKVLPESFTGNATSVKFGRDATYLAVGSMDHNLRTFVFHERSVKVSAKKRRENEH